jgi:hypothetical protein
MQRTFFRVLSNKESLTLQCSEKYNLKETKKYFAKLLKIMDISIKRAETNITSSSNVKNIVAGGGQMCRRYKNYF